ncbi:MAG: tripartite tricarboxylate transporter substrate binding protein [Proteobacteria bacterium]|nr:tripartite tricarboxylate transporter substrate binding protein [Pseudomonadota bacterium]
MRNAIAVLILCALASLPAVAVGQAYPSKPIRIVVGFAPGGPADIITRLLSRSLAVHLGQPVVVDNRPGADANIAMELVARASPDGYTLLLAMSGLSINPSLYGKVSYDSLKDFVPITLVGEATNLVAVHPSVPVKNLKELIDYTRANPDKLNYASSSSPTHMATEMFKQMAGVNIVRVPYKGAAPAIPALLSGQVQFMISSLGTLLPHAKANKVHALAVTSARRSSLVPDVPTVDEAGVPGYSAATWYGISAPAGTPRAVIDRLNSDFRKILIEPEIKAQLLAQTIEASPSTPEEFGDFIRADIAKWQAVVKASGAKID